MAQEMKFGSRSHRAERTQSLANKPNLESAFASRKTPTGSATKISRTPVECNAVRASCDFLTRDESTFKALVRQEHEVYILLGADVYSQMLGQEIKLTKKSSIAHKLK